LAQGSKVDVKAEEASLRALIAKDTRPGFTEDRIAWSGAEKRPSVGSQRGEAFPEAQLEKRKNSKSTRSVQRLEVSASGDMAWEFSYGTLEFDLDVSPPRHVKFEQGILRVWKKMDGQWKVAASFTRPLDVPFVAH
jgi:ketosteroid isomerase-like protein